MNGKPEVDWTRTANEALDRVAQLEVANAELLEALKEIAKGEGAYSRDPLTHAGNVITNMKVIANQAIRNAEEQA